MTGHRLSRRWVLATTKSAMLEKYYTDDLSSCQAFYHNILIFHTDFTQHIVFHKMHSISHFHILFENMESGNRALDVNPNIEREKSV